MKKYAYVIALSLACSLCFAEPETAITEKFSRNGETWYKTTFVERKAIDYRVLSYYHLSDLESAVRALIEEGWQPIGGIMSEGGAYGHYCQAMVRYSDESDKGK